MRSAIDAIIGETPVMLALRELIRAVARTTLPVLIEGPTGSGKELVAAAIHEESARRGPFVAFNVCAIADSVFEAALFGHVRGAFTGAIADAPGYLREANGGTVFLDEIGALPMVMQAKLLRALETQSFRPVGARADVRSDFRIIAATNERTELLVADGRLRADLVHRIAAGKITVPSLAERRDDIPLLVSHFAGGARAPERADATAVNILREHTWPGNVRELRNVVGFASALGGLTASRVRGLLSGNASKESELAAKRRSLRAALEAHAWNVDSAARSLGVANTTIYRQMKKAGLTPPAA